jgi:hypothetical protein
LDLNIKTDKTDNTNRRIFLIDFENVHEKGLEGIGELSQDDAVHLFYTKNASKISLDILSEVKAALAFHKVNVGKQSLDMQLVSYLGYLIGTVGHEPEYIIISNDTGFGNTLSFWGNKHVRLSQAPMMCLVEPVSVPQPKTASVLPEPTGSQPAPAIDAAVPAENTQEPVVQQPVQAPATSRGATLKTQMNNKITVALRDKKVESDKIGKVTAAVMKLYGYKNFRQAAYREVIRLYGQKEGLELYNIIKPILTGSGKAEKA